MLANNLSAIILAAGQGKRMLSDVPKVMHQIAGKSMLQYLIDLVIRIGVNIVYIVVHRSQKKAVMNGVHINIQKIIVHWIVQDSFHGTGHAVQMVLSGIHNSDDKEVLILYGDVPLISDQTLRRLYCIKSQCDISLLTATLFNPYGYGRIIRNQFGHVIDIIEHSDIVDDHQKKIKEISTGVFITIIKILKHCLSQLIMRSISQEWYLTDIISIADKIGYSISTTQPIDTLEVMGVNNKLDLVNLDRKYQKKQALSLLLSGVIISDPNRFDLRGVLVHGRDVFIDINVIIEGNVVLGNRVKIGAGCILKDSIIADDVVVFPFSIIENSRVNIQSSIGPFARIRPGTELQEKSYVGNFVELKNTKFGKQSKVGHLSYLGDAEIGTQVNIGAGTIICNYDGINKHRTIVGDGVFVGGDSQLVAPVIIGNNATIGAGTTVTQDVAAGETVISRIRQFTILSIRNLKKKIEK